MNKETLKGWKQYRLNDLFIINPPKDNISNDTEVSFIAMKDVSDAGYLISSEVKRFEEVKNGYTYFKNDDIILAKITPCFENGKMAVLSNLTNNYGVGSTEFYVFRKRPNANILPQILYYIFKEPSFRKNAIMHMSGAAGQKRVQRKFLEYYPLSIPLTTAEQQEIVQVLDTMSDIIRLREECISHAQDLIPALFQEIFKPYVNYTKKTLNNLFEFKSGGTPSRLVEEYFQGDIPWITTVALSKLYINEDDANELITEEAIQNSSTKLIPANSLLFGTRVGIGKLAINTVPMCTNQDIVAMIPLENNNLNLIYVYWYLKQINNFFVANGRGATIQGITTHLIRSTEIIIPPLKIQEQFAQKVIEIEAYIKEQQEELENAKQMFQSLLHHAFTGELTSKKDGECNE